jgi:hypothetical protein
MDALLNAIYLLLHWRFALSVAVSIAAALALSSVFAWFTAGYCITLVLFATAFGLIWQGRGEAGIGLAEPVPETPISHPVAFLSFAIVGLFWGGVASYFLHSNILAALFLVSAVAIVGAWYRWGLKRAVSAGYLTFAALLLLLGYGSVFLLKFLTA